VALVTATSLVICILIGMWFAISALARQVDWDGLGAVVGAGSLPVGQPAPDFTLRSLDGETVRLDDLRGRPVLIEFWATWCPPCRMAMPHIQQMHDRYAGRGLQVLALSTDYDPGEVRDWLRRNGVSLPVLMCDGQTQMSYRAGSIPRTYLLDGEGTVRFASTGFSEASMADLEEEIRALLEAGSHAEAGEGGSGV
jgi:peroxiredoxin